MFIQSPTTRNLGDIRNVVQKAMSNIGFKLDLKDIRVAAANIDALNKSQKKALSTADNFAQAVALKGVNYASYAIATNAVAKLGQSIAEAATQAVRFEKELSVLAQTVNISFEAAKSYSEEILSISKNYGLAQTKTAELVRVLAQAGLSLKESLKAADALAKTTLIGTFDSLNQTTEAFIALMSAFNLSVNDATKALETINVVSKAFAVESNDIVEAITRAGGAFKAAGGNIQELIALFTSVRSYSRESAETIATGFRAILGRLQRTETVKFFKDMQIELRNANGEFVGGYEAIKRITEGLEQAGIKAGDVRFANVVEQIGGIYQLSRVVALLDNFKEAQRAMMIANKASAESDMDVAKAKETLAFRIDAVRANFAALITEVSQTASFKAVTEFIFLMTDGLLSFASAIKGLLPLLVSFASIKIAKSLGGFLYSGLKGMPRRGSGSGAMSFFAEGGFVPGSGDGDTVPAMLTPGEFVVNKKSAQQFGYSNLRKINKYARGGVVSGVQKFADGGPVLGVSEAGGNTAIDRLFGNFSMLAAASGPLVTSFGLLQIQMRLATGIVGSFTGKIKEYRDRSAEQAKKTAEIVQQLDDAKKELSKIEDEVKNSVRAEARKSGSKLASLTNEISAAKNTISFNKNAKANIETMFGTTLNDLFKNLPSQVTNIISGQISDLQTQKSNLVSRNTANAMLGRPQEVWNPGDETDQEQLKKIISDLKSKYRDNARILSSINDIQKALPGEIKSQIKAVSELSDFLYESALEEQYIITENKNLVKQKKAAAATLKLSSQEEIKRLQESRADEINLLKSNITSLEAALPKKTSFKQKALGFAGTAAAAIGPDAVYLGIAALTSSIDKASEKALSLAENLEKSGDAIGAEKEARAAAEGQIKSSTIQSFATIGAAAGAALGSIVGPIGTVVGTAAGSLVGALLGLVNSIFKFTDMIGLTSYQSEIDAKALEAATKARITSAEKEVALAKESFDKFSRTDPTKSLDQLETSISEYIKVFEQSKEISLSRGEGLESGKNAFKEFIDIFSSLSKSAEFAGMSFDELSKKNPRIAQGLNKIAVATGNTDWLKSFITEFNVLQTALRAESASRRAIVEEEIKYIALQKRINLATSEWSKSLRNQTRFLRSVNFSRSGTAFLEKVDLSNFELDNTKSENFNNALDSVSQAFPDLSATVKSFKDEIKSFDMAKFELSRLQAINLGTNENAVAKQRADLAEQVIGALEGIDLGDLEENIRSQILGGQDPTELLNKMLVDKANALQKPLDLITDVFNNYAEVLKERVDFESRQLDQSIAIQKSQQSSMKMISDIISNIFGENPIAEYQTALQNRLANTSTALQGTRLSNLKLSGGARDIGVISASLEQNKRRQKEIDAFIATGKTVDEFGNTTQSLMKELSSLQVEAHGFKTAMDELADTTKETSAAQKALEKSLSQRAKIKETAGDLAFGTRESRSQFLKTMQQTRLLAFTGNIGSIKESDRQSLKSFLTEFKDLPVFNGLTGGKIMDTATSNFLLSTGSSIEEVKYIMDKLDPIEEQMLKQMKETADIEAEQLTAMRKIEANLFNAPIPAGFSRGGSVFKPKGSDTVPAMLTPGEFIMSKSAVGKIGAANLEKMNSTGTIYANEGGIIEVAGVQYDKRTDYFRNRYNSDPSFKRGVDLVESINSRKQRKIGYAKNLGIDATNLDFNDPRLFFDQKLVDSTISSIRQKTGEIRDGQQVALFDQYKGMTGGPLGLPNAFRYAAKTVKNVASGYSINESDELMMQEVFGAPQKLSGKLIDDTINEINSYRKSLNTGKGNNIRPLSEAEMFAVRNRFQSVTAVKPKVSKVTEQPVAKQVKPERPAQKPSSGAISPEQIQKNRDRLRNMLSGDFSQSKDLYNDIFNRESEQKKDESARAAKYSKMSSQLDAIMSPKPKPKDYLGAAKRVGSYLSSAIPKAYETVKQQSQQGEKPRPTTQPQPPAGPQQPMQQQQVAQTQSSKAARIAERLKTERNPNIRRQLMIGYQYQQRKQQLIDRSNSMYGISQARKAERDKKEALKMEFDKKRGAESLSKMSKNPYYKGTEAYSARIAAEKDAREKAYKANQVKDIQEYDLPQLPTNTADETINNLNKIIQKGNEQKIKEADEIVKSYGYGSKNFDPTKLKEAIRNRRILIDSMRQKPQARSPKSIFGRMKENKNREDVVPAMLTPGEFVLNKDAVSGIGVPALNKMNKNKVQGFAKGGLVGGGSTGGFNNTKSNSSDYSVLTQSLSDFNSMFSESVRQLVEMPKVFEISLQNVGVNVNLNGAEFLAKLPDVLKSIVLENIQSEIGNITTQVKKNLSSGN